MQLNKYIELYGEVRRIKKQYKILSPNNTIERKTAAALRIRLQNILTEVKADKPRLGLVYE